MVDAIPMSMESITTPIPKKLVNAIEAAIVSEVVDLAEQLDAMTKEVLRRTYHEDLAVVWGKGEGEIVDTFDKALMKELEWLRSVKNTIGRETLRAEDHGKLDGSRIYRIAIDNLVFKRGVLKPRRDREIVVVSDASSSMRGNEVVYSAMYAIGKVLHDVPLYEYASSVGNVEIHRLDYDGKIVKAMPRGGTPSGTALLAVASRHPGALLIHFTDGNANRGFTPKLAFDTMVEKLPGTEVITVIYQGNPSQYEHDISEVIELQDLGTFPVLLRELLRKHYAF